MKDESRLIWFRHANGWLLLALILATGLGCAPQNWNVPVQDPGDPSHTGMSHWRSLNLLNIDKCSAIPPGAVPNPIGTYTREWQARQAFEADADHFVIYLNEWYGPYGLVHLNEITKRLTCSPHTVVIQPCLDEETNQMRRGVVVAYLASHGVPDADARVIIAFPKAEGLTGPEAQRAYQSYISGRSGTGGAGGGTLGTPFSTGNSMGGSPFGGGFSGTGLGIISGY